MGDAATLLTQPTGLTAASGSTSQTVPPAHQNGSVQEKAREAEKPGAEVSLPFEQVIKFYQATRELEEIKLKHQKEIEDRENAKLIALAKAGEVDEAFKKYRAAAEEKLARFEQTYLDDRTQVALAESLAGVRWASETHGKHGMAILRSRLTSERDSAGNVQVYDRETKLPAKEAVKAWLAGEGSIYVEAGGRGGSGATTAHQGGSQTVDPKTAALREVADNWKRNQAGGFGLSPVR